MKSAMSYKDLAGKILIASPSTHPESYFAKTVIYLVKYNNTEGAIGLVVNQPLQAPADGLIKTSPQQRLKDEGLKPVEAYAGGPVEVEKGFILHSDQASFNGPTSVYLNSNVGLLKSIAQGKGPKHSMFLFGYCGWNKEQLEDEIKNNDWLILPSNNEIIFETNNEEKWYKALNSLSIKPIQYLNQSGNC